MAARSARTQSKDSTPSSARASEDPAERTFIPAGMQTVINVSNLRSCCTVNTISLSAIQHDTIVRRACHGDNFSGSGWAHLVVYGSTSKALRCPHAAQVLSKMPRANPRRCGLLQTATSAETCKEYEAMSSRSFLPVMLRT